MGFFQGPEKNTFSFFLSAPKGPEQILPRISDFPVRNYALRTIVDPLFLGSPFFLSETLFSFFFTVHGFWKRVPSSFTHGFFCFLFSIARCSVSFFAVKKNAFKLPCVHWRSSMQCCRNSLRPHALEAVATLYHQAFKDEEFEKLSSVYSLKK